MRTKLTDIISTMAEYFHTEHDDDVEIEIDTDLYKVSDTAEATLTEMLTIQQYKNKLNEHTPYRMENVKPFEQFINEINQTTYTTTQSYFGCLDDIKQID